MLKYSYFYLALGLLASCGPPTIDASVPESASLVAQTPAKVWLDPAGTTIATRFPAPEGFTRMDDDEASFAHYLRHQPLKPHGSKVKLFNGDDKGNQRAHAAVLTTDVEPRNLQQCADAVMRLRAEYLYGRERYDDIHFNFVSGFNAEYSRWRKGQRIQVKGNNVSWTAGGGNTAGYKDFRRYLTMVFAYAGTASLVHELHPKALADIEAGDVLIKGGSPGHAVLVVDKAVNAETGEVLVLLAQSYMPAQDIHVLVNPLAGGGYPWYSLDDFGETIRTAEYTFGAGALRGF